MTSHSQQQLEKLRRHVRKNAGQRLTGERELAQQFELSRPRLREMLSQLEREGLVERRHGSGTYAISPDENAVRRVVLLMDANFKLGNDPFVSTFVEKLQNALQRNDIQCFLLRVGDDEKEIITSVPRHDAVLALGLQSLELVRQNSWNKQAAVGLMAPANWQADVHLSLLQLDDEHAGAQAAMRVLKSGCRRAVFFGHTGIPVAKERLNGVRRVLEESNIALQTIDCSLNYAAGLEQSQKIKASNLNSCAFIAGNDWLALGLRTGLQNLHGEKGASVPIISFDGLEIAQSPQLKIQSLSVPLDEMVSDAIEELRRLKQPVHRGRILRYPLRWTQSVDTQQRG